MHFDPTLCTAHSLPGDAPQQTLALVAVSGRGGGPHLKIVRCGAGNGVDESLQGLLVYVVFLLEEQREIEEVIKRRSVTARASERSIKARSMTVF